MRGLKDGPYQALRLLLNSDFIFLQIHYRVLTMVNVAVYQMSLACVVISVVVVITGTLLGLVAFRVIAICKDQLIKHAMELDIATVC